MTKEELLEMAKNDFQRIKGFAPPSSPSNGGAVSPLQKPELVPSAKSTSSPRQPDTDDEGGNYCSSSRPTFMRDL